MESTVNTLFDFTSQLAASQGQQAAATGQNEYFFGEFASDGTIIPDSWLKSAGLRAGDIGPTPEPTTEERQYDDGTTRTYETGENLGSKTLEIEGPSDEPLIALLIKHSRYGSKRGRLFPYEAFNDDRTCFYGSGRIQSAAKPRDVKGIWRFVLAFQEVLFQPASQNPAPVDPNDPAGAMAPTTGLVGATVTVTGTNLDDVTSVTFGAETIAAASFVTQSATEITFAVPAVAAGDHNVDLVHPGGTVDLGDFTVTSA